MSHSYTVCRQCEDDFTQAIINYIEYLVEDLDIDESKEILNALVKKCNIGFAIFTSPCEGCGENMDGEFHHD
jgi:hypothetical protein